MAAMIAAGEHKTKANTVQLVLNRETNTRPGNQSSLPSMMVMMMMFAFLLLAWPMQQSVIIDNEMVLHNGRMNAFVAERTDTQSHTWTTKKLSHAHKTNSEHPTNEATNIHRFI